MLPERVRHSFDINVLLGNLLENAIEAAGKTERKYLSVHVKLKRGILKVKIENSFESSHILYEEQHGKDMVLKTTKPFTEQHGIGLKNVKKIVEKYNGTMAVTTGGHILRQSAPVHGKDGKRAVKAHQGGNGYIPAIPLPIFTKTYINYDRKRRSVHFCDKVISRKRRKT